MKNSQLSLHTNESGAVRKSDNGGLAHLRINNKVGRANIEKPERCPVKLYKKYISHVRFLWTHQMIYFNCDAYQSQREIFSFCKLRLLEAGKRWEMLL